jgi:hypothetical protein
MPRPGKCRICRRPFPRLWCDSCRELSRSINAAIFADFESKEDSVAEERNITDRVLLHRRRTGLMRGRAR